MNLADQLQKLHTLREQGALTEDEFTLAKKRLLDGSDSTAQDQTHAPSALNQFRRSMRDKWIGGVCGGLGEATHMPSWAWRILFLLTVLLNGLGLLVYLLMLIFVPGRAHEPYVAGNGSGS